MCWLYKQGTAMASLVHMQKILSSRMQHFPTIQKAVCMPFIQYQQLLPLSLGLLFQGFYGMSFIYFPIQKV